MKYLSCFSGIGGLEGTTPPYAVCEIDRSCQIVLSNKYPEANLIPDIRDINGFSVDVIVGGWPCQDLSVAGKQVGLSGSNSGLFYALVEAAITTNAKTLIAENVTNLLRLDNGEVFREVLRELKDKGYNYTSWRTLNARQFGLPHNRNRVFLIASYTKEECLTLFRSLPKLSLKYADVQADGFYWTAGLQSINYSKGYVPTIKVGSTLSIASPPAVVYCDVVRQLTTKEALRLQGFQGKHFNGLKKSVVYKMAGNAVAVPVGRFVVDGVFKKKMPDSFNIEPIQGDLFDPFGGCRAIIPGTGFYDGEIHSVTIPDTGPKASNLGAFLDLSEPSRLSARAANGLLKRLETSGQMCPENLKDLLLKLGD